ncbi:hypothetical protein G647_07344 [Cladophialophora carrionii CBS 160.54]|uniref:Major facilitator superfamily (MFS) profile domain-containing protein n=1 Tax=Cladophialophora carrionii CBS 160.54 TaxID=1279043 RepID=V9D2Z1_9EURO|nr:uncharacterized protein G647_07344 [Cladophialophora carrionii CBS 160.54]ETI21001.1 hypothetical protein G647_07344 [Cladophialophora carrionii CBS 160.54]
MATIDLNQQTPRDSLSSDLQQPRPQEPLPKTHEAPLNMRSTEKEHGDSHSNRQTGVLTGTDIPKWKPNFTETMIMVTLAILSLMVSLDATVIVTSLSTIVQALDATATQGFWIGTSYLLVVAVTMPFTASISDIVGRPQTLFITVVSFTVGTILCAVARSIGLMLVGRCLQGIGGGGVIIISLVIFSDIVPLRFRPQYVGVLQGAWALGSVVGPIIGGALAHPHQWRWVFYIMLPFCGIGLVCIPLFIRIRRPEATVKQMLSRVDWIGGFLFIASATGFLVAISWGGTSYPWNHWRTLVPLILGILGLIATMIYERFGAKEAFLRHSLFHVKSAHGIYIGAFVQGLVLYAQLYYIPFFYESVKLYSPIRTGVSLLPILLTLIPASVIVGAAITRTGTYLWAIAIGWALTTLGTGLTISWDRSTHTAVWAIELIILGVGHGLNLNALNTASQAVSKPGDEGRAVGMYAFLRSFGMAIGVGVSGSVFQNVMKSKLKDTGLPTDIATNAEAYLLVLKQMGDTPERQAVIDAYVSGFHGVFAFLTALAGVALILGLFIRHHEINKELISEHKIVDAARIGWRHGHSRATSREELITPPRTAMSSAPSFAMDVAMQSREMVAEHV